MDNNILILCTGNSCRSQMAEGYLHSLIPEAGVYSAGLESHGLNPRAVSVMLEDGVDISNQESEVLEKYIGQDFSHIITVCDHAAENCPVFPGEAIRMHESFPDPAKAEGSEEEILNSFRNTRNLIKDFCAKLAADLLNK